MQRLEDRAFARAVGTEQQGDRLQIDHLCRAYSLEVLDLDPTEAHVAILKFAAKGALGEGGKQMV